MSAKLKPCPFCGSDRVHIFRDEDEYYFIICENCECSVSGLFETEEEATRAWNTRAEVQQS